MLRFPARAAVAAVTVFAAASCAPTNPFDPATPPEFQQRGTITGKVQAVTDLSSGVTSAGLCDVDIAGDHSGFSVALRPLVDTPALGVGAETQETHENGAFALKNIPPGRYSLEVSRPGYEVPPPREITVTVASVTNVTLCAINRTPPSVPALAPLPSAVRAGDGVTVEVLFKEAGVTYTLAQFPEGAEPLTPIALPALDDGNPGAAVPLTAGDGTPARRTW
ncbi:MAG TPA: carboxypeptidase-like regulatory domain-containing protein, partial [Myxococcota bacterium]